MKPEQIKAELVRRKISVSEIARREGCSVVLITRCINGDGLYLRTREAVCAAINKPVTQVFNKYHPKPKRKNGALAKSKVA